MLAVWSVSSAPSRTELDTMRNKLTAKTVARIPNRVVRKAQKKHITKNTSAQQEQSCDHTMHPTRPTVI